MKAWLLKDFGLDNLQMGETPTPQPRAGELLVKVGAVSLNFRDKAIVDGIYEPHKVPKPLIPVSDAAGTTPLSCFNWALIVGVAHLALACSGVRLRTEV